MTDRETVTAAINVVIKNGMPFDKSWNVSSDGRSITITTINVSPTDVGPHTHYGSYDTGLSATTIVYALETVIYNHRFAKALWGDEFINPEMRDDKGSRIIAFQQTAWRHHLRQMVTADDPIAYLRDHLPL